MPAQAETARRMQAEYEAKVVAIKAEGERRREAELRRRQQRYATLDRLQAAAASQVGAAKALQVPNTSQKKLTVYRSGWPELFRLQQLQPKCGCMWA